MAQPFRQQNQSFVVRLWLEAGSGACPQWRGQIEHVGSGEKRYFRGAEELVQIVSGWTPGFMPLKVTLKKEEK